MMSRGFPNLFIMPAPGQQAVVTVNYTQLAVLGAEFVGGAVGILEARGVRVFDVSAEAEERWSQKIVDSFVDASRVMSACTPSRINQEGHPESLNPRNGNYGRGLGDYFGYRELLRAVARAGRLRGPRARRPVRRAVTGTAGPRDGRRVVVVTGGGGGIGAAIAEELGRDGAFVVTMDPLVSLDGTEPLPTPEETTAERIVAAGGSARASSVSVTDGDAVRGLFAELVDELGRLDAVVNVAGITPPDELRHGHARRTGSACSPCTSTATSTSCAPRCRSWPPPDTAASSASPRARGGARPTPVPTAAPSGPWPRSPGSWAGRRRPASSSTPCRRSP